MEDSTTITPSQNPDQNPTSNPEVPVSEPAVEAVSEPTPEPMPSFEDFNFHPDLMKGIRDMRYQNPTPIQAKAIPPVLEGRDVIANAQTGSGKTAAFLLPLMHRAAGKPDGATRILVIAPTRELACQIEEQAMGFGYHLKMRSASVYGGTRFEPQEQALLAGTAIIVATPGRLLDHHKYGSWRLDQLEALVLDEADRMLDMGFWPDVQSIMEKLPNKNLQFLLFSATMPEPVAALARTFMKDPVTVKAGVVRPPDQIRQTIYLVDDAQKGDLLVQLLEKHPDGTVIVFVGTKMGVDRLTGRLTRRQIPAGALHGDMEQAERDEVLNDFRTGKVRVLVATDVASRGLDISGVSHVINFDLPQDPETYIHRIGRTARAGAEGDAMSLVAPYEREKLEAVEKAIGKPLERASESGFESTGHAQQESRRFHGNDRGDRGHRSHGRGGRDWRPRGPRPHSFQDRPAPSGEQAAPSETGPTPSGEMSTGGSASQQAPRGDSYRGGEGRQDRPGEFRPRRDFRGRDRHRGGDSRRFQQGPQGQGQDQGYRPDRGPRPQDSRPQREGGQQNLRQDRGRSFQGRGQGQNQGQRGDRPDFRRDRERRPGSGFDRQGGGRRGGNSRYAESHPSFPPIRPKPASGPADKVKDFLFGWMKKKND